MKKHKAYYDVTIIENDGRIVMSIETTRESALKITNAAEKVRNCQAWRITYTNNKIVKQ